MELDTITDAVKYNIIRLFEYNHDFDGIKDIYIRTNNLNILFPEWLPNNVAGVVIETLPIDKITHILSSRPDIFKKIIGHVKIDLLLNLVSTFDDDYVMRILLASDKFMTQEKYQEIIQHKLYDLYTFNNYHFIISFIDITDIESIKRIPQYVIPKLESEREDILRILKKYLPDNFIELLKERFNNEIPDREITYDDYDCGVMFGIISDNVIIEDNKEINESKDILTKIKEYIFQK